MSRIFPAAVLASLAFSTLTPARAQVVVPERTEVRVTLNDEIKSGLNKTNEEVAYTVASDVYSPDHKLLIPAGTPAFGTITKSSRRGMFGKGGKLDFTCEYVRMPDGTHIPLRSNPLGTRGKDNAAASVATAVLLAPVAIFINGKDVTIKKGTEFKVYVDKTTAAAATSATAPAAVPPAASAPQVPGKSLFTLKDGTQIIGVNIGLDNGIYTVGTDAGEKKIPAAKVKSIFALK